MPTVGGVSLFQHTQKCLFLGLVPLVGSATSPCLRTVEAPSSAAVPRFTQSPPGRYGPGEERCRAGDTERSLFGDWSV